MEAHGLRGKTILLDCRWLGLGGPGRTTELLLRGLRESEPPGRWVLWGPPMARAFLWGRAEWYATDSSPMRLWGQRAVLQTPASDIAIYLHQVRPLRPGRSLTLIHDTIPLRYGAPRAVRLLKRGFLAAVARLSSLPRRPGDAARVRMLREHFPRRDVAIYVGRFAPHKNFHAPIAAFQATRFRQRGGHLRLIGGSP